MHKYRRENKILAIIWIITPQLQQGSRLLSCEETNIYSILIIKKGKIIKYAEVKLFWFQIRQRPYRQHWQLKQQLAEGQSLHDHREV
jgi:hypothetical protein